MSSNYGRGSNNTTSSSSCIVGLLGILFVALKLCKVIDWSWWLVTLPFWGGLALLFVVGLVFVITGLISAAIDDKKNRLK